MSRMLWVKVSSQLSSNIGRRERWVVFFTQVSSEEEFDHKVKNPIYDLPKKEGGFLVIAVNRVDEGE